MTDHLAICRCNSLTAFTEMLLNLKSLMMAVIGAGFSLLIAGFIRMLNL